MVYFYGWVSAQPSGGDVLLEARVDPPYGQVNGDGGAEGKGAEHGVVGLGKVGDLVPGQRER